MGGDSVYTVTNPDGYVVAAFPEKYMAEGYVTDRLKEQGMNAEEIKEYRGDFQISEVPLYEASIQF